jgi:hypothetical protein
MGSTRRRDHRNRLVGARPGDIAPQQRARARVLGDLLSPVAQERCGDTIDDSRLPPAQRVIEIARRRPRPVRRAQPVLGVIGKGPRALARQVAIRIMRERDRRARALRNRDILVESVRRAIARRLIDAGNMSLRGTGNSSRVHPREDREPSAHLTTTSL